ncbi:MAG: NAD(P)-dependent oxidoreductase [Gloeocapsa sp. UFS-A4-WI-NPMV-4B04]|nr:NAD(P)-dependent oxidoreductase [Gloeocapsa sp. UFS-A4-WI-NPMV-4B04]
MDFKSIGFIGLGSMGQPIASSLLAAGYSLRVYNRTASKADMLVDQGAVRALIPTEVVEPGGIVITMLTDDKALESVVSGENGFLPQLGQDGIHLSMSTVSPALSRALAEQHAQHGSRYVAATVFGRPDAAAAKKLFVNLSGSEEARSRVRPLLEAIGQKITDFGDDPGAANVVKLCGNFLIGCAIEAMGEAVTLAEKAGVDPVAMMAMFSQAMFACPVYQNFGLPIAHKQHEPAGVELKLALKDLNLVQQVASSTTTPLPLANLLHDRMLSAVAKNRGQWDWTALALGAADDAGLNLTEK